MKQLTFKLTGRSYLLMHNGQTSDPLNHYSIAIKQLTSKKKKTEDDYRAMGDLEWQAGVYLDEEKRPCIPGEIIEATLVRAARMNKRGKQAQAGLFCTGTFPLVYDGQKPAAELLHDPEHRLTVPVRVQQNKVIRTCPLFKNWGATITVDFDDRVMNEQEVVDTARIAGESIGIMDWRPKFGRFDAEVVR